ncbi:FAD-binding protein [Caulobacter segnis]
MVWTKGLRDITLHDDFTPQGSAAEPVAAVSVGAGCLWVDVYDAVVTKGGRYVQGGGCTTVGVAGLVQGGGFGSFSKGFGLAAASLLEAEIVTADGVVQVVNAHQEPDLFWALKGGGGGTFGVVTRLTLQTHDLPTTFGAVRWTIQATSDQAFRDLIACFVQTYAAHLLNPHWGEQVRATPDNQLVVSMVFQGLDALAARAAWADLVAFVQVHPKDYQVAGAGRYGHPGPPFLEPCRARQVRRRRDQAQRSRRGPFGRLVVDGRQRPDRRVLACLYFSLVARLAAEADGAASPGRRVVRRQPPLVGGLPLQQGSGRR